MEAWSCSDPSPEVARFELLGEEEEEVGPLGELLE